MLGFDNDDIDGYDEEWFMVMTMMIFMMMMDFER